MPGNLALTVYCTGRRPDAPGDGPGPVRAAPLPSAWVVVDGSPAHGWLLLVKSCEVAGGPKNILDWCASTAPHASTALLSRPPALTAVGGDVWRTGPVRGPLRPRSVTVVGWVTAPARPETRKTRQLGRVARPGARPRAAGWAQPRAGEWGSKAESEKRSKPTTLQS